MDKQQATTFVINRLRSGQQRADIVAALAHRLNAPEDVVARFVEEIAAGYAKPPFEPEIQVDLPSLEKFIITEGNTYDDAEELVYEVCRRTGWKWSQAEAFIEEVLHKQKRRRALAVFLPGLLLMVSGVVLIYTAIQATLQSGLANGLSSTFITNVLPALIDQQWPRLVIGAVLLFTGLYALGKATG